MGRSRSCSWAAAHAQFAALMHEAAHRLLFRNRKAQRLGRALAARLPVLHADRPLPARPHGAPPRGVRPRRARHPALPRLPDRRGLVPPQARARRDRAAPAGSCSRDCCAASRRPGRRARKRGASSACSSSSSRSSIAVGHPWVYWLLWFLPYLTVWRVINRLRSIAEHGGMQRSKDRRETTHTRAPAPGRPGFVLVPFHIGWHLAHHVDSGVPMKHLPRYHAELVRCGLRHRRARVPALHRAVAPARVGIPRSRPRPAASAGGASSADLVPLDRFDHLPPAGARRPMPGMA